MEALSYPSSSSQFEPQLKKLADITLSTDVSNHIAHGLSVTAIIKQGLQSAQTWELPNFRSTLAAIVTPVCANNGGIEVLIASVMEGTSTKESPQSVLVFQILLLFPTDYLPRSSRIELIKRAQNLDFAASDNRTHLILRTFLARELTQPDFLVRFSTHVRSKLTPRYPSLMMPQTSSTLCFMVKGSMTNCEQSQWI